MHFGRHDLQKQAEKQAFQGKMDNQVEHIFTNELEKDHRTETKDGIWRDTDPSRTIGRQKPFEEFQRKLNSGFLTVRSLLNEKYNCFWYPHGGVEELQSHEPNNITNWLP